MAWVRQHSAPNVVGARKLKALIFYKIYPLLYENGHFAFLSPSSRGRSLEITYAIHLRLIGKPVVDFLLVIIELFCLGAMVHSLRENIDWKSLFLKGWVTLTQYFR